MWDFFLVKKQTCGKRENAWMREKNAINYVLLRSVYELQKLN